MVTGAELVLDVDTKTQRVILRKKVVLDYTSDLKPCFQTCVYNVSNTKQQNALII